MITRSPGVLSEQFQPVSIKPPSRNPWAFRLRCFLDLQLGSIVKYLRPAMDGLNGRVLDVGAGESPWREWLPKHCHYQGIDVNYAGDFGMSRREDNDLIYYDGQHIPFPDKTFHGVLCIEVLEHTPDPDSLLSEIFRVMKPGATLLLTVPWSARCHHRPYDYHRFTKEQLSLLLCRNGFSHPAIRERGSDISVIANKLIVLSIRMLMPERSVDMLWTVPLGFFVVVASVLALVSAHLSDWLGKGSKDDPLGYFCRAERGDENP